MKKVIYLLSLLIVVACGNKSKSDSSEVEDDTTDYTELEQKAYNEGYADGSGDASDGKPYRTSFNTFNLWDVIKTAKKRSQTWAKGYSRGYDDGFNNGRAALQKGSNSRIEYQQETVTYTETPNTYSSTQNNNNSSIHSSQKTYSNFTNYEETDHCVEGVVVYEGDDDYFIVETRKGYTLLQVYSGILYEGDNVRGELNKYQFKYLINRNRDSEVRVYIEDYMLSEDTALKWLGEHEHLKTDDQKAYDYNRDN